MSTKHAIAAERFLADKEGSTWHNQSIGYARTKRDIMAKEIPEWEQLRELSSEIKRHTVTHLDHYLEEFSKHAEGNGVIVHWQKMRKNIIISYTIYSKNTM